MLPRLRLDLSGTPGLRFIGLSPGSWQTNLGLGSMSRYSAEILICILLIQCAFMQSYHIRLQIAAPDVLWNPPWTFNTFCVPWLTPIISFLMMNRFIFFIGDHMLLLWFKSKSTTFVFVCYQIIWPPVLFENTKDEIILEFLIYFYYKGNGFQCIIDSLE